MDFSRPCEACADGRHGECAPGSLCGCIVFHDGDEPHVRGFKRIKQGLHPERAAWTKGGFGGDRNFGYPEDYRDPEYDGTVAGFRDVVLPARVKALERSLNEAFADLLPEGAKWEWVTDGA